MVVQVVEQTLDERLDPRPELGGAAGGERGRHQPAQPQAHNRAKVLAAVRDEFTERGFRDAKIDAIAERAQLTRGAVYSNFPGKRALYFAVLAEDAERASEPPRPEPGRTVREALGALARAWVARLPLATDDRQHGPACPGVDLLPEILADEQTRRPFAQLVALDAISLGLALERLHAAGTPTGRLVRVAEVALTTLHGASQLAAAAPGFGEPFDVVRACEQLAELDLGELWQAPAPRFRPAGAACRRAVGPAARDRRDQRRAGPARRRRRGCDPRAGPARRRRGGGPRRTPQAGVTSTPDELAPLGRLAVADLRACLLQAFPPSAWPHVQVVIDESGALAAAVGVPAVSDVTETAVCITAGRIVARAEGFGACHAAASHGHHRHHPPQPSP